MVVEKFFHFSFHNPFHPVSQHLPSFNTFNHGLQATLESTNTLVLNSFRTVIIYRTIALSIHHNHQITQLRFSQTRINHQPPSITPSNFHFTSSPFTPPALIFQNPIYNVRYSILTRFKRCINEPNQQCKKNHHCQLTTLLLTRSECRTRF